MLGENLGELDQRNLIWPVIKALQALGGEASAEEIYVKVIELENFNKDFLDLPRRNEDNRYYASLAWARTSCKNLGFVRKGDKHSFWDLTDEGKLVTERDIDDEAKRNANIPDYYLKHSTSIRRI